MIALLVIVGLFLAIVSVLDLRFRVLPSVLLTTMLFVVAFLNPANLWFGIMSYIIAYLLWEFDFFSGTADIKVMTTLGFMIPTTTWMFVLMFLTVLFGLIWKIIIRFGLKKSKKEDYAFLPVFVFVYLALLILGGIR
jgi:hypothetical protein